MLGSSQRRTRSTVSSLVGAKRATTSLGTACAAIFASGHLAFADPPLPTIPSGTYNVTSYGAVGDGSTTDTTSIQSAINAANAKGGGTVVIPAGTYMSGPLTLDSNINFDLSSGAIVRMLPEGTYPSASTNFITLNKVSNTEITGSGTIDGQGAGWWGMSTRPRLVNITGSNIVAFTGVTFENSPEFHLAFGSTNNVTINGITISAPASSPNTDGIDAAGSNYLIENSNISDGDDDIAAKPQSTACSNIVVNNCTIGSGHGISVGGETNDGLNGMTVENTTFNGTTNGLRLKAGRGNGGVVQNVTYDNITMTNVQTPIDITSYYLNGGDTAPSNPASDSGQAVTATTPFWDNITFDDVTATGSSTAGEIYGLPEAAVQGLDFDDVSLSATTGMELNHAHDVNLTGLTIDTSKGAEFTSYYDVTTVVPEPTSLCALLSAATLLRRRTRR